MDAISKEMKRLDEFIDEILKPSESSLSALLDESKELPAIQDKFGALLDNKDQLNEMNLVLSN